MNKKFALGLLILASLGLVSAAAAQPFNGEMNENNERNMSMQEWMQNCGQMYESQGAMNQTMNQTEGNVTGWLEEQGREIREAFDRMSEQRNQTNGTETNMTRGEWMQMCRRLYQEQQGMNQTLNETMNETMNQTGGMLNWLEEQERNIEGWLETQGNNTRGWLEKQERIIEDTMTRYLKGMQGAINETENETEREQPRNQPQPTQ